MGHAPVRINHSADAQFTPLSWECAGRRKKKRRHTDGPKFAFSGKSRRLLASKRADQPQFAFGVLRVLGARAFGASAMASGGGSQIDLHLTEFQRSACPCSSFGLAIAGKIAAPVICSLDVLVLSLQQQCEVEHCISVVRGEPQRFTQAFDGAFNASLLVQQITKVVPGIRKCRIDARRDRSAASASTSRSSARSILPRLNGADASSIKGVLSGVAANRPRMGWCTHFI
jgi:hypothetical protein